MKHNYQKELFLNQIWHSSNFLAKALFLALLTPLMLRVWGKVDYGLYAVASSLFVTLAILDGGVRCSTRLRLSAHLAEDDQENYHRDLANGFLTFLAICIITLFIIGVLAITGSISIWLNLPPDGNRVMFFSALLTIVLMLSFLATEPIAAEEHLSITKLTNTIGALIALPIVAGALWLGCSVLVIITIYTSCLIIPNLVLLFSIRKTLMASTKYIFQFNFRTFHETISTGFSFYATTIALIISTHFLTFIVSIIAGPAIAGIFYILLRITEIISNVGSTASETALATLAKASSNNARASCLKIVWLYVCLFSLHGAILLSFLGRDLLALWLPELHSLPFIVGPALATFGIATAFARVVINTSMGLPIMRTAATANLLESILVVCGAVIGYRIGNLEGLLFVSALGSAALLPQSRRVANECGLTSLQAYIFPLYRLIPGLALAASIQLASHIWGNPAGWVAATALSGGIVLIEWRKLHRLAQAGA